LKGPRSGLEKRYFFHRFNSNGLVPAAVIPAILAGKHTHFGVS